MSSHTVPQFITLPPILSARSRDRLRGLLETFPTVHHSFHLLHFLSFNFAFFRHPPPPTLPAPPPLIPRYLTAPRSLRVVSFKTFQTIPASPHQLQYFPHKLHFFPAPVLSPHPTELHPHFLTLVPTQMTCIWNRFKATIKDLFFDSLPSLD